MPYVIGSLDDMLAGGPSQDGAADGRRRARPDVAARNRNRPNPTRDRVLEFIEAWIAERVNSPTVREIIEGCEISSTSTALYHLAALVREGRLIHTPGVSRGYTTPRALGAVRAAYRMASTASAPDERAAEDDGISGGGAGVRSV
jgi:hypothetical protein